MMQIYSAIVLHSVQTTLSLVTDDGVGGTGDHFPLLYTKPLLMQLNAQFDESLGAQWEGKAPWEPAEQSHAWQRYREAATTILQDAFHFAPETHMWMASLDEDRRQALQRVVANVGAKMSALPPDLPVPLYTPEFATRLVARLGAVAHSAHMVSSDNQTPTLRADRGHSSLPLCWNRPISSTGRNSGRTRGRRPS